MRNISLFKVLAFGLLVSFALACGGGGSSSSSSVNEATLRLAGGKAGDVVTAYNLKGETITSASFDSTGKANFKVPQGQSVHLVLTVNGVALFEGFVTKDELAESSSSSSSSSSTTKVVTLNAATTVMTQEVMATANLLDIYNYELAQSISSSDSSTTTSGTTSSTTSSSVPSDVTAPLGQLSASTHNMTFSLASGVTNSPIANGATATFLFSSSGTMYIDNVAAATTVDLASENGIYTTLRWTATDYTYYVSMISGNLNEINVNNSTGFLGQYVASSSLNSKLKARQNSSYSKTLASCLTSFFGVSSISNFSLANVSSASGLSTDLKNKIKFQAILTSVAIRAADEGTLTSTAWNTVLAEAKKTYSSSDALTAAKAFQAVFNANLSVKTPVTVSDFGSELLSFLGSVEVASTISALQSGDVAGVLGLMANLSSENFYQKGVSALEAENMLKASEYFISAVAQSPTSIEARVMSAVSRVLSMGIKNTPAVKAFQKAAQLEYNFVGNDALEALLDQDDEAILNKTNYVSSSNLTGLMTMAELQTFVKDVFIKDVELSIADLEALDLSSMSSSSNTVTITLAMQGKDANGNYNATSPIVIDAIDIYGLKAILNVAKAKAQYFVAQNFEISGATSTAAETLNTVYDAAGEDMLSGEVTMSLNGSWLYESGLLIPSDNFLLGPSTLSFKGDFPGEVLLVGVKDVYGNLVKGRFEPWNLNDHQWLIYSHYNVYNGKTYTHYFEFEFDVALNSDYSALINYPLTGVSFKKLTMRLVFAMNSLNGSSDWTIELFQEQDYGYGYTYKSIVSGYHANYSVTSGSWALDTTRKTITDATVETWVNSNANLGTATTSYLSMSRDSLMAAGNAINKLVDGLQAWPVGTLRPYNIFEDMSDLKKDNNVLMTTAEIDGVELFGKGMLNSLYGASTVNPTVFGNGLTSGSFDASILFNKNIRDYAVVGGSFSKTTDASGNVEFVFDEAEGRVDLSGMLSSDTLFGTTLTSVGTGNIEDVFGSVSDNIDLWYKGTTTSTVAKPTNK